jgi:cytochrome c oxidase subunit III
MAGPKLAEHFDSLERQNFAARLGMWVFLGSELLIFAGLFALYVIYRMMYGEEFRIAEQHNDPLYGTINTAILITSSFTVAWAIHTIRAKGSRGVAVLCLVITILCGFGFGIVKSLEYAHHFHEGIYPGNYYAFYVDHNGVNMFTAGAKTFFTLYYFMTGLHVLHVIIGLVVLVWMTVTTMRGRWTHEHYVGLELGGLYWHLVDLIWIFLWPMLYLTRN